MRASHKTLSALTLLVTAVAVPAFAQPSSAPVTNYPVCTGAPSKTDSDQAHEAFKLGKRFFDEADYASAIHNFVDAYKLDCTKTELLTIIARANELAGSRTEAVHALEVYVQRATSLAADDRAQIQKRIENLKAQIAAQAPTAATTAPTATVTAMPTATAATTATTPTATASTTALPPPPGDEHHHTVLPWVVAGIGLVAAGVGVTMVVVGHGDVTSADNDATKARCSLGSPPKCPMGVDPTPFNNRISSGNTILYSGWAVGGVGAAALVGGLLWHFFEPTGPKTGSSAAALPTIGRGSPGQPSEGSSRKL